MTPAEAIARGRVIASGEQDPIDVAIKILQRVSEDDAISLKMSPEALRGAAHHHAKIVQCLSFMVDSLDAEISPLSPARMAWRSFSARAVGYLGHNSAACVFVALGCAINGGLEVSRGSTVMPAALFGVACLNLFCAWISYRRTPEAS